MPVPADLKTPGEAIRYALSIPEISCAVIGLASVEELERAARVVARARPLSEEEAHELSRKGLELAGSPQWRHSYGKPLT